jgi:PBP1b-binding outer membrane lipoprotein LpoB
MIKYKALIIFSIFAVILGGCSKDSDEKAGTSATEITVTESADNESVDSEDESAGQRRVVA